MMPYVPPPYGTPTPEQERMGPIEGDDVEIWIPPVGESKTWLPSYPCEACGHDYYHLKTARCMKCGVKPPTNSTGEFVRHSAM